MSFAKHKLTLLCGVFILLPLAALAQETSPADKESTVTLAIGSPNPAAVLSGLDSRRFAPTGDVAGFSRDNLRDLAGERYAIYVEYGVSSAASREYSGARADLYEAKNQAAAFGLFSFFAGGARAEKPAPELGGGSARLKGELIFWKRNYFARVVYGAQKGARGRSSGEALARAIADAIGPTSGQVIYPPLLDSLPKGSIVPGSERYFLGPEALSRAVDHAREMFEFEGDTEAVTAEYSQSEGVAPRAEVTSSDRRAIAPTAMSTLKLVIGEYHTPQFATDAMARASSYVSSLPENEQQGIIIKRAGNYVVAALGVRDRQFAESLVNSIEYPYTVKWLRNPLWPTNDPFRAQKAAEMLLSTFGLLGLILLTVIAGGTVFGTTIFLKRRKRQREIFSDAGGMLRLDLDPFESVILGLPPKRDE